MAGMPAPGDRVGSFELEESIGVGGMGAVYRALDLRLERHVALKTLPPEQSNDSEVVQRFYQEARAAARLDHENIARVFEIGHDKSCHYIAFEYIEGTTIRQRVQTQGPLPVSEAINFTLQIAGALVHAVERGVVHRDIKPSNIIVTPQGRAKLVDMGLARRFERGGDDDGLTQSGMTLGTFDYISPEQARDPRDVDVRSDLYSLGCTLFYMLTASPPFPEGTVLQKLLQHQEEPAPDVRLINPAVPADLSAILLKLMAKDRDRRYQTPEQLVRDLLTLAGALGLRSMSPEGLVWMSAAAPPSWERHLVWGIPTMAFALVVVALLWWGQPLETLPPIAENPDALTNPITSPAPKPAVSAASKVDAKTTVVRPVESPVLPTRKSDAAKKVPIEISVKSGDDLGRLLADAPSGSTLTLRSAGPFELKPVALRKSDSGAAPRDLTIRAATDVHPVLRVTGTTTATAGDVALLHFGKGRVSIEGIEFALDSQERDAALLAIDAEGTDLSLNRCLFRRTGAREGGPRVNFVRVRPAGGADASGDRPPPVVIRETFFDEGEVGLWIQGVADVQLRDCLFGPSRTCIWLDQTDARESLRARLGVKHASIIAGDGPVFRISGGQPTIRVDDSVVSPPFDTGAVLLASDAPESLDWLGRGNVFAGISTYLQPTRDTNGSRPIARFEDWSEGALTLREIDSVARETVAWEQADPVRELARKDPTPAFALAPSDRYIGEPGARRGPGGLLAFAFTGPKSPASQPKKPVTVGEPIASRATDAAGSPAVKPKDTTPAPMDTPGVGALANSSPNKDMDPMTIGPAPMERPPGAPGNLVTAPMERPMPMPGEIAETPAKTAAAAEVGNTAVKTDENTDVKNSEIPSTTKRAGTSQALRTAEQLLTAIRDSEAMGATLTLAAGAEIDLPTCIQKGKGRLIIRGPDEPGAARPRLRFHPSVEDVKSGVSWPVLFRIRSGSLELQGVDVVLGADEAPPSGRWAAFGIWAGADLNLVGCSVTIEGEFPRSAILAVQASENEVENGVVNSDPSAASVRMSDSIVRGGGDLADVAAGRRLDLGFTNVVVSVAGSFMHGHGLPRGQEAEPIRLSLRQVTARVAGGLVQLESAIGEPELPVADVTVRDSILATSNQGAPMLRVDGQEALDGLQDRIRWEGHAVAYHHIEVYRRDQTAQPGNVPRRFDRPSWEVAVGPAEDAPFHGDLRFVSSWDDSRPAWTLTPDDVRLQSGSPARNAGAELSRIPEPPRSD